MALWFTAAVALVLLLSIWAAKVEPRAHELLACAAAVTFWFAVKQALDAGQHWLFPGTPPIPPWTMVHYPLQDVTLLAACWFSWRRSSTRCDLWKPALGILFLLQLAGHCRYWLDRDTSTHALYVYIFSNNVLFALELGVVGVFGGGYVGRDLYRRVRLAYRRRGVDAVGAP